MEQDKPKNLLILGYTLAIVFVLIGTVIFVDQYLKADVRHEYERKVLQAPTTDLNALHAAETGRFNKYVYVDQANGVVRLTKERARELVLKEWAARPDGVAAPVAAPGAAPAAPAAPTDGTAPAPAPAAAPGTPGSTPTQPGASAPTPAKEPPSTAQPAPYAPGETPPKGPADGKGK
jgi:hypothetical protein